MDAGRFSAIVVIVILAFTALPQSLAQEDDPLPCKSDFVPVMRPDNAGTACVTSVTAEKFIQRGWSYAITEIPHTDEIQPTTNNIDIEDTESITLLQNSVVQPETPQTIQNPSDATKDAHTPVVAESITTKDEICHSDFADTLVEPLSHSITDGEFLGFCADIHYKWFAIYLDTDTGGSITLEIPKDIVDLKQYDYLDCYRNSYSFDGKRLHESRYSVKQVAQSDDSRTIEITFDKPVGRIQYFGAYGIFDGVDYSQPNYCIDEYEKNGHDPAGHLPRVEPNYMPDPPECPDLLDLNYTITGGRVDKICGNFFENFEEGYPIRNRSLDIHFSGIRSLEYLTIEIPWYALTPDRILGLYDLVTWDKRFADSKDCISTEIVAVTPEYYTLKIPVEANEKLLTYGGWANDNIQWKDISEIVDSIRPPKTPLDSPDPMYYDSKFKRLQIAPFDKNVDGKSVRYCDLVPHTYTDDFASLDNWITYDYKNWHIVQPSEAVPNENIQTNTVASSSNCGTECILLLAKTLNTARELLITFDRFIAADVDHDDGLYIQYKNNYRDWITLAAYTGNNSMHTGQWTSTNLVLDVPRDITYLRFLAQSDASSEIIAIDNLSITPSVHGNGAKNNPHPTTASDNRVDP